ncbi:MAG: glycosyltransferase [Erysipelotrichales bacterium]|nr:glycosyltransferase [Erysipelotrichales bacterium]
MENPYKLSIITINLNNKEGLQKTIDSVISQTCKDFEWIVIDGGSTDGSKELIEKYSNHINYWVSEPDKGIYNAMNKGVRKSHGEYLLFLNSGDYLYNSEVLINVIPFLKDKDFYFGNEQCGNNIIKYNNLSLGNIFFILSESSLCHQSTFIKKNIFKKYGYYREDYSIVSDWILYYTSIIMGKATLENLNILVAVFDMNGKSQQSQNVIERNKFFKEIPNINNAITFYYQNFDIVKALKKYRIIFFLFRIYYYFYRKNFFKCRAFQL